MYILVEYLWGLLCCMFKSTVSVTPFSRIDTQTSFGGYNKIGRNCIIEKSSIGRFSYIGNNCVFTNTHIGNFCSISSNVEIISGTHPTRNYVSTHPVFYSKETPVRFSYVNFTSFIEHKTTEDGHSLDIGNDVWIGNHVCILEGVTIGDGAIIAAGSIVVKDIPPYSIVGGVPAKIIRKRLKFLIILIIKTLRLNSMKQKRSMKMHKDILSFIQNQKQLKKSLLKC